MKKACACDEGRSGAAAAQEIEEDRITFGERGASYERPAGGVVRWERMAQVTLTMRREAT